jgi:hypothetical protein
MSPSSSSSASVPSRRLKATQDAFWSVVEELTEGMEIHPGSEQMLRDMIAAGLKKMRSEGRETKADVVLAQGSLATFIIELRRQVRESNHPDALGEDTTDGAAVYFQTMQIQLWPFIPPPWRGG